MTGALDGVRVVELAQWVAAPAAGGVLADWGAEVIHVEHPIRGDAFRGYQTLGPGMNPTSAINYTWELINRNKKSVTLDLTKPQGREALYKLIATADVFLGGLRPTEQEKYHVDYHTLTEVNPRLIFANMTGYGAKGPDADSPGFDFTSFWARSGIMQMLTQPGGTPPGCRPAFGDRVASLALASSILLGLLVRERTGVAQAIDVSLLHSGIWALGFDIQSALTTGQDFQPLSREEARNPLVNYYQTKDKRWIIIVSNQPERYWPLFCRALEREDLEHDPRFDSFAAKITNHCELTKILDGIFATKTKDEWKERLDAYGVPWSPVQTITEVTQDPQALANEYFMPLDHPTHGRINLVATPGQLSKTPATIRTKAPELGEHTEEVLLDLGYDWDAIAALREQGIIA